MKSLIITMVNNDIFEFGPDTYDRYVVGNPFVLVYYDNELLNAFNSAQVMTVELRDEEFYGDLYE